MRIGINTLFLIPGEVGGSQTYFCETFGAMVEAFAEDDYVLFTQVENDAFLRERFGHCPCVSFVNLNFRATNRYARIIREQAELPWRARKARVDVLWSPGYTAPILSRVPQVLSILDMQYKRFPEDLSWLARFVTDILLRLGVWRIRSILTISEFSKSEIVHFLKVDPDRILVTHLAASESFADPQYTDLPSGLPVAAIEHGYVLCVANTYPHKNVHTLIAAFGAIAREHQHALVLVGKPRLGEGKVQAALERLPPEIRSRIIRLDQVTFSQLVALYRRCSVFVVPSLYEGFGLPVLEALLAGARVVASDIPTHREIGGDFTRYVAADSVDPLCKGIVQALIGQNTDADRDAGVRWCRTFSWRSTAEQTHRSLCRAIQ